MERCLKLVLASGLLAGLVGVSQPLAQGQTKSPTAVTPADYLRWVSMRAATPVKVLSSPTSFARPRCRTRLLTYRLTPAVALGRLVE